MVYFLAFPALPSSCPEQNDDAVRCGSGLWNSPWAILTHRLFCVVARSNIKLQSFLFRKGRWAHIRSSLLTVHNDPGFVPLRSRVWCLQRIDSKLGDRIFYFIDLRRIWASFFLRMNVGTLRPNHCALTTLYKPANVYCGLGREGLLVDISTLWQSTS